MLTGVKELSFYSIQLYKQTYKPRKNNALII